MCTDLVLVHENLFGDPKEILDVINELLLLFRSHYYQIARIYADLFIKALAFLGYDSQDGLSASSNETCYQQRVIVEGREKRVSLLCIQFSAKDVVLIDFCLCVFVSMQEVLTNK